MEARATPKVPTATSADAPTVVKPTPKKDTVRIDVPAGPSRVAPQATVKIQQAQPAIRPEPQVRTLAKVEDSDVVPATADDPMLMVASLCVLVFAAVTCAIEAVTYFAN